jgi:hypothetical protein
VRFSSGCPLDDLDFIVGTALYAQFAVMINRDADVDWPATYETVFDVLLMVKGIVNDQFDRFATVRTVCRYGRQHRE